MTNSSRTGNGSRSFSSLFRWSSSSTSREMTSRSCYLDVDGKGESVGVATELSHFDDDEAGHLSYTSLRDLLPSTSRPGSPVKRAASPQSGEPEERSDDGDSMWERERLPMKNRLVEQAARAYLLPVSSQKTAPDQFLARYWARLTTPRLTSSENLLAPPPPPPRHPPSCVHGCTHVHCLSCLPTVLWVDLTRVVHALFSQLRTPSLLSHHAHVQAHAHSKAILRSSQTLMSPSLVTPSLVK